MQQVQIKKSVHTGAGTITPALKAHLTKKSVHTGAGTITPAVKAQLAKQLA